MTQYLLDTTAIVDHLRGRRSVIDLLTSLGQAGHRLGVCCISIAEAYAGLRPQDRAKADLLIHGLEFSNISSEAAKTAGRLRYDWARSGVTLHITDALIASVAIEERATLITANVKDFPMQEVHIMPQP
ncbi:MAG: PIN domain-containing protein [Dehalococcoidia bacterium]|nr:PIN domain-containing protein [Dehalococcoidia bacterium]